MLTANLLPPEEKERVEREETSRLVVFFTTGIIIILAAGSILLLPSYMPLFLEGRELDRALVIEKETAQHLNIQSFAEEIRKTKTFIRTLSSLLEKESRASWLMEKIFSYADGVSIQSLQIEKNGNLSLRGRAATRQSLLAFERSLRESGFIDTISLPLSQIIRETDISFSLSGILKEDNGL